MQIYQNNKLVATLEKAGACLGENIKTNKLEMLGNIWGLKDSRGFLIDNLVADLEIKAFSAEMLLVVCKRYKSKLALSDEEVEVIADNQEELEKQRIVINLREKE